MTFRQRFLFNLTDFEEIFDLTDQWNFSDETCTLREFLGLTPEEEDIWISESDEALEEYMEKEKNTCVLFTDIDGTLLNDDRVITEPTIKALNAFLKKGNYVVLATGRARCSTLEQAEILGLKQHHCYAICYNGAQIYDIATGECIYNDAIPLDLVRTAFDEAKKFGIHIQTYTQNEVIAEAAHPELDRYAKILKIKPYVVSDVVEELNRLGLKPPKMLAINTTDTNQVKAFREHLQSIVGERLNIFFSNPYYMEMVSPTVNKGNAVRYLCEYLGIRIENSIAAGDAENDIAMLAAAGQGVAMCNGTKEAKKAASYVTKNDNNHDGLIEALSLFHQH